MVKLQGIGEGQWPFPSTRRVADRHVPSNYRGVSLLSVAGKWFGKVLNTRLRGCTEGRVMEEQGGFRAQKAA